MARLLRQGDIIVAKSWRYNSSQVMEIQKWSREGDTVTVRGRGRAGSGSGQSCSRAEAGRLRGHPLQEQAHPVPSRDRGHPGPCGARHCAPLRGHSPLGCPRVWNPPSPVRPLPPSLKPLVPPHRHGSHPASLGLLFLGNHMGFPWSSAGFPVCATVCRVLVMLSLLTRRLCLDTEQRLPHFGRPSLHVRSWERVGVRGGAGTGGWRSQPLRWGAGSEARICWWEG